MTNQKALILILVFKMKLCVITKAIVINTTENGSIEIKHLKNNH